MPESKISDSLEVMEKEKSQRKRRRPPKKNLSLLNSIFEVKETEKTHELLSQKLDTSEDLNDSPYNIMLSDKTFKDSSKKDINPRKRGRRSKLIESFEDIRTSDDESEVSVIPRKRGRPRKADNSSLITQTSDKLYHKSGDMDTLQSENSYLKSITSPQNYVSGNEKQDDVASEIVTSQKRDRSPKSNPLSPNNASCNEICDVTGEVFSTARKRGRTCKSKSASLNYEEIDVLSSDSAESMYSMLNTASNDTSVKLVTPCKRGRPRKSSTIFTDTKLTEASKEVKKKKGRPKKSLSSSLNTSFNHKISNNLPKDLASSMKSIVSNDTSEKLVSTPHKKGRPPKPKSSSSSTIFADKTSTDVSKEVVTTSKKKGRPKSNSSLLNMSFNRESITLEEKSKQLKLEFSPLNINSKEMNSKPNSSPQRNHLNSEKDISKLKFYPIFTSPSLNKKEHVINQETRLKENCKFICRKTLINSKLQPDDDEMSIVKLIKDISINDHSPTTDLNSSKISDLTTTFNEDVEIFCNAKQQKGSNNQDGSAIKIDDTFIKINTSDKRIDNLKLNPPKVKLKQETENMFIETNSAYDLKGINKSNESGSGKLTHSDSVIKSVINIFENQRKKKLTLPNNNEGDCIIKNDTSFTHSVKGDTINSSEVENGNENVKEKVKLFPIFTSNKSFSVQVNVADKALMNSDCEFCIDQTDVRKNSEMSADDSSSKEILDVTELRNPKTNNVDQVSDSLQLMCPKVEEITDSDIVEVIDSINPENNTNYHSLTKSKRSKKLKHIKSVDYKNIAKQGSGNDSHISVNNIINDVNPEDNSILNSPVTLKQNKKKRRMSNEIIEPTEMLNRRRSLRNRVVRDAFVNYSEMDCDIDSSVSRKSDNIRTSKSTKQKKNDCVIINNSHGENSLEVNYADLSKVQEKNEKEKNLFKIFSSNKELSDHADIINSLNKGKSSHGIALPDSESNNYHRQNSNKNQVTDTGNNSGCGSKNKHFIQTDNFISSEDNKMTENYSKSISKKSYKSDIESICFPKLTHVNFHKETLVDGINNFQVNFEGDDSNITVPLWSESLIDINCAEVMKSLEDNPNMYRQFESNSSNISINDSSEDVLWTDSIQNTVNKGKENENLVKEVKSWLVQWKDKFSKCSKPRRDLHSDSESYSSGSDDEDFISNSIIIYGTPGSGKTSLVFSLADELGFKVLEVNASSHRSGRNISNQLKEALESYHMQGIKMVDSLVNSNTEIKRENSRKSIPDEFEKPQTKNIKSFFETGSKEIQKTNKSVGKKQNITSFFASNNPKKVKNMKNKENKTRNCAEDSNEFIEKMSCRISSSTIILFDDVDIVFEEDEGFWSTVKGFLKISKKPVIFTVSRNLPIVKNILNSDIQVFNMIPASKDSALETLKSCCKIHSRENLNIDFELLTSPNPTDIRRSILNTQFWSKKTATFSDSLTVTSNSLEKQPKFVCFNNFIAGDQTFSANYLRQLLFNHLPNYSINAVSDYQRLGYDILFNNYFNILNILESIKPEEVWKTLHDERSCSTTKSFTDSQMWEEACEIFRQKKRALKSGSCSKDLLAISNAVDEFSFADMLKGLSLNRNQCISVSERIKLWTAGLPICNDHISWSHEDILQIVSLIQIHALRKAQNEFIVDKTLKDSALMLEHPFTVNDQALYCNTENDLTCISAALPVSQQLNKTALTLDYLSIIKNMCKDEESRQLKSGKRSGRFLHYFDSISFLIDRKAF